MTEDPSRVVLDRLQAAPWGDWDLAYSHARSRAHLMSEYLRRSACWANAFGAEKLWPFFDIGQHIDPTVRAAPDVMAELDEFVDSTIGRRTLEETCRGAVHWPAFCRETTVDVPNLPDPYEPLLLMFERGGGFYVEEMIELDGIAIPLRRLSDYLSSAPAVTLDLTTLDALDAVDTAR
ncbi:hypothetical protein [Kitasatospora sp. NBC_00039]|uniref:hypothetical protein n=1 Tax=Kitasatospora sp. NBC_00039 TaxID=2903565 RepID=UPI00324C224D